MGLIADAFARVLAFTTQRTPPSYTTPPTRPPDPVMRETNTDTSVTNIRSYVSVGPARTASSGTNAAGDRPTNESPTTTRPLVDTRGRNIYPQAGSETATNTHATTAAPMPYGVQKNGGQ